MPNLLELNHSFTSKALARKLNGLNLPFNLRRYSCSGNISTPVICLLKNQPLPRKVNSATSLRMFKPQNYTFWNASYIPQLEQLSGPINVVSYLVSLRPTQSISIVDKSLKQPEKYVEHVGKPTTLIISVHFIERFCFRRGWHIVVERLKSADLCTISRQSDFIAKPKFCSCYTRLLKGRKIEPG